MPGRDAHFLHKSRALEALVSPQIEHPRALGWTSEGDALVVVGQNGSVSLVDPAFGTQALFQARRDPVQLAIRGQQVAILSRDGVAQVWDRVASRLLWEAETALIASFQMKWWRGGLAVIGDDLDHRRVIVYTFSGKIRARARVPLRTALGTDGDGALVLARSTEAGLTITPFGEPLAKGEPTQHALRFGFSGVVIGVATGGVTLWRPKEESPVNVKLYEVVNAAISRNGDNLALGTRNGGVAIAAARPGAGQRVNLAQVEGHDGPVIAMAFAPKGRWLATAAERCWVWSY